MNSSIIRRIPDLKNFYQRCFDYCDGSLSAAVIFMHKKPPGNPSGFKATLYKLCAMLP